MATLAPASMMHGELSKRMRWTAANVVLLSDDWTRYAMKLMLYESRGVQEYWIADRHLPQVAVYRCDRG